MPYESHEDSSLGNIHLTTIDACEKAKRIDFCTDTTCSAYPHCPKATRTPITSTQPHKQPRPLEDKPHFEVFFLG